MNSRSPDLRVALILVAVPLALTTTSCQAKLPTGRGAIEMAEMAAPEPAPAARTAGMAARAPAAQEPAAPTVVEVPSERKLIRNGSMSLEVDDVPAAIETVKETVTEADGYVGNESERQDGYGRKAASITCRVPAEQLDAVVERLRALGEVDSVSLTAQDVTDQYFDLEVRLATQRELAERLQALLGRPSNELSDLLEIERELARVRGEIDRMEGRKRLWDQQIALSTLQVDLHEPAPEIASGGGGVWRTLISSFRDAGENFVLAIAGIVSFSGGLIPVLLALWVAWIVFAALRRRRRRAKALASRPTE